MDKQELLNKKSELEKELGQVNKELWDYDVKQLAEQYKDKFTCEFCRYNSSPLVPCSSLRATTGTTENGAFAKARVKISSVKY